MEVREENGGGGGVGVPTCVICLTRPPTLATALLSPRLATRMSPCWVTRVAFTLAVRNPFHLQQSQTRRKYIIQSRKKENCQNDVTRKI